MGTGGANHACPSRVDLSEEVSVATKGNNVKTVWAGFVRGRPAINENEHGDKRCALYPTQADARVDYIDVRKVWLVWPVTRKTRS